MELILLQSVEGLGHPGDQVKVRDGYARNYLMPKGKAVPVSPDALRGLSKLKKRAEEEEKALLSTMEQLAAKIAGAQVQITARATEEGHLFGSVTERDVHHALTAAGWQLPLRAVRLAAHLKQAGTSDVELHLHGAIMTTVKVEVLPVDADGNRIEVVASPTAAAAPVEAPAEDEADAESADAKAEKPAKGDKAGKADRAPKAAKSEGEQAAEAGDKRAKPDGGKKASKA
ncbi:MAG TPA: 50S ribosomal protein L9 [Planctomycetota bacterium]|nr:50S ribosomal protein L9 [Planctomycetota bacterium]